MKQILILMAAICLFSGNAWAASSGVTLTGSAISGSELSSLQTLLGSGQPS